MDGIMGRAQSGHIPEVTHAVMLGTFRTSGACGPAVRDLADKFLACLFESNVLVGSIRDALHQPAIPLSPFCRPA